MNFINNEANVIKIIIEKSNKKIKEFYEEFNEDFLRKYLVNSILGSEYKNIINEEKLNSCLKEENFTNYNGFKFWKVNEIDEDKKEDFNKIIKDYEDFFGDANKYMKEKVMKDWQKDSKIENRFIKIKVKKIDKEIEKKIEYDDMSYIINKLMGYIYNKIYDINQAYSTIDNDRKTKQNYTLWPDKFVDSYKEHFRKRIDALRSCANTLNKTSKNIYKRIEETPEDPNKTSKKSGNNTIHWMKTEANNEEKILENKTKTFSNILNKLQFSKYNLPYNGNTISKLINNKNILDNIHKILYTEYIIHQKNKIFLLGSFKELLKYTKYRDIYYVLPCVAELLGKRITKFIGEYQCSNYVEWSLLLNNLFLLIIKYSKNDISSIIILNEKKEFTRKIKKIRYTSLSNKKLIGFLFAPYITPDLYTKKIYKSKLIIISIFQNDERHKDLVSLKPNYYLLYNIVLKNITSGFISPFYTILYQELRLLFEKYSLSNEKNLYIYYDKRKDELNELGDYLFISRKSNLENSKKYPFLKKGKYIRYNKQIYIVNNENIKIKNDEDLIRNEDNILLRSVEGFNQYFNENKNTSKNSNYKIIF